MYDITSRVYESKAAITKPTGRDHDFQSPVCVKGNYRLDAFMGEAL